MSKMKNMFKKVHFCEKSMHEKPTLVRETQTSSPLKPDAEDEIHSPLSASGGCNMMNLFGIKSYIHHFYDKKSINNRREHTHNILLEPSAEPETYLIERGKRRYSSSSYFRTFIVLGMIFLCIGLSLLVIGHFHTYRNPIVDIRSNIEIIDRRSIAYNASLEMYRLVGLAVFCAGGIVIMLTLLVDICRTEIRERKRGLSEREQEFYIVWE
ncbi:neurensin-1-like [Diaphorina citri]|uniref:Neurensin-1-like n=1 Tax=Diaphorina citri TaxID=121845 RepID=A0A1S4E9G8_DIACI|nr:neurensin-1-like [Diaphorina citri]XP_017298850.1 neurensin-1-like [Diaphorina citri]XP_026678167.1 neurensin-1-like [Diaphorina citri]